MSNAKTTVANLAQEASVLFRHNNLDARVYEWMAMTFNDIASRHPLTLFNDISEVTVLISTGDIAFPDLFGTPVAGLFVDASNVLHLPEFVSPNDFSRIKATSGASVADGNPRYWTIRNDGSTMKLHVFPDSLTALTTTIIWSGKYIGSPLAGSDSLALPYHFEHVVIWGTAAMGAKMTRSQLFPLYNGEYEQALGEMFSLVSYQPDASPAMRSISGDYPLRFRTPPRVPDTI